MTKSSILGILFVLWIFPPLYAEDGDLDYLWENIDNISPEVAGSFFPEEETLSDIEGIWQSKSSLFMILETPDNNCDISYRIVVVEEKKGAIFICRPFPPGSVTGLIKGRNGNSAFDCLYKTCIVCKPHSAEILIDNGLLYLKNKANNNIEITAKKIYPVPVNEKEFPSPLRGPIPRN